MSTLSVGHHHILKVTKKKRDDALEVHYFDDDALDTDVLYTDGGVKIESTIKDYQSHVISNESNPLQGTMMESEQLDHTEVQEDTNIHYLAILPVLDSLYQQDLPKNSLITSWLFQIQLLIQLNNQVAVFPLNNIDDDFKYKTAIRNIIAKEWNITKKSVYKIKHVVTEQRIHFYLVVLKNKLETKQVKTSLQVTNGKDYCWKPYFLTQPIADGLAKERPYHIKFPTVFLGKYIVGVGQPQPGKAKGKDNPAIKYNLEELVKIVASLE